MGRFTQAISEGDGISVIPVLQGDVGVLAAEAEVAGAEAVVVSANDVAQAREATGLPVVVGAFEIYREADLRVAHEAGADGCVVVFDPHAGEGESLEDLRAVADELELDCAIEIRDEDGLAYVLERFDPDVIGISDYRPDPDEEEFERALDLLPDIPAGKLVIVESRTTVARDHVVALERAGVDALIVRRLAGTANFGQAVEELVGGARPS